MTSRLTLGLLLAIAAFTSAVVAQPPDVIKLQGEIEALRSDRDALRQEVSALRTSLEQVKKDLKADLEASDVELLKAVNKEVEDLTASLNAKSRFYVIETKRRGLGGDRPPIFKALPGGLFFTGHFRSRFEYRNNNIDFTDKSFSGAQEAPDDEGVRLSGRFKLGFGADILEVTDARSPRILVLNEFQADGDFSNNVGDATLTRQETVGGLSLFHEPFYDVKLYQGYLDFRNLIGEGMAIRVGRQEMTRGSHLILGSNSFFGGVTQDAAVFEWDPSQDFNLSAFFAKTAISDRFFQTGNSTPDFDDDYFTGLYVEGRPTTGITIEAYGIFFDTRDPTNPDNNATRSSATAFDGAMIPSIRGSFWTLGTRLGWYDIDLGSDRLGVSAEVAYQTGSHSARFQNLTFDQTIAGWNLEVLANYWLAPLETEGLRPIFSVAYYFAEGGDDAAETADRIGWQPLFPTRHWNPSDREYTAAPYYIGGGRYGNLDLIPLHDIHIFKGAVSIAPVERTEVGVAYSLATVDSDIGYGTGVFGHEIDLFGSYQYESSQFSRVVFTANFSLFLPQDAAARASQYYFNRTAGGEAALGFYLQALVEF